MELDNLDRVFNGAVFATVRPTNQLTHYRRIGLA